jgi:hypothetical protein
MSVIMLSPHLQKGAVLPNRRLPAVSSRLSFSRLPAVPVMFFEPLVDYPFGKPDVYPQLAKGNTALYHPMPQCPFRDFQVGGQTVIIKNFFPAYGVFRLSAGSLLPSRGHCGIIHGQRNSGGYKTKWGIILWYDIWGIKQKSRFRVMPETACVDKYFYFRRWLSSVLSLP